MLRAVRARRRFLVVGALAGLLLAGLLTATAVRTYVSSTELFVSSSDATDAPAAYQGSLFTQERVGSYAELLTSRQLAQQVVDDLQLPLTAGQVAGKVAAAPLPNTDILQVTVTDTSPQRAQVIAASLGRQFAVRVADLETPDGEQASAVEVSTIEPASFSAAPVSPSPARNLVLGTALGLLVGLALALLRERWDSSVQSKDDVEGSTGAPLLTRIGELRQLGRHPLRTALGPQSPVTSAVRAVRLHLQDPELEGAPRVLVVTSPVAGEGKSTVALALSVALARSGSRVVLVEGNLWRPRLTRYLGLDDAPAGLSDVLAGTAQARAVTRPSGEERLSLLPAGPMPDDPGTLLGSPAMRDLLAGLRESADVVVVDAPPLLPVVDAADLCRLADGCLFVTRYGSTTRDELQEAAELLTSGGSRLLGVVLNRVPGPSRVRGGRSGYQPDSARVPAPARSETGHLAPRTESRPLPASPATRRAEPEPS